MYTFKIKDGINIKKINNHYYIYDNTNKYLGKVNECVYDVLLQCDGNHSTLDIVNKLNFKYKVSLSYLKFNVPNVLKYMEAFGVISSIS